jgi:hypothetical protein
MLLTLTIPSAHVARADTPVCAYVGHAIASPAGFDPLNATDDQRRCYGFPPRPTDATSLAAWTAAMRHARSFVDPQVTFMTTPLSMGSPASSQNANWAGYVACTHDQTSYTNLQWVQTWSQWIVQSPKQSSSATLLDWNGLGGAATTCAGSNTNVAQAGTWSCDSSGGCDGVLKSQYGFWLEQYPYNSLPKPITGVISGMTVSAGDTVYVSTILTGFNTWEAFVEDFSTNKFTYYQGDFGTSFDQTSAEWVYESVNIQKVPFNQRQFSNAGAEGSTQSSFFGNVNGQIQSFVTRAVSIPNYASPTSINRSNSGFNVVCNVC